MLISIIIPAYNEENSILDAVREIKDFFLERKEFNFEIIVVDDGSTDQTAGLIRGEATRDPRVRLLQNVKNSGKGYSVKAGMQAARGDYRLFLDADMSTPIAEFDRLWKSSGEKVIVIGSRGLKESVIKRHQPKLKEWIAKLGNLLIRCVLRLPFHDTQCGFKLFPKSAEKVFELQTINRWGFDMELLFIARHQGFEIKEVPVEWTNDPSSLVRKLDYVIVLTDVVKILTNHWRGKYTHRI